MNEFVKQRLNQSLSTHSVMELVRPFLECCSTWNISACIAYAVKQYAFSIIILLLCIMCGHRTYGTPPPPSSPPHTTFKLQTFYLLYIILYRSCDLAYPTLLFLSAWRGLEMRLCISLIIPPISTTILLILWINLHKVFVSTLDSKSQCYG